MLNGFEFQTAVEKVKSAGAVTWAAVALLAAGVAVTGWHVVLLGDAILTPTPRPLADPGKTGKQIEQYTALLDSSVKQADGRTLFILPVNPKSVAEVPKEPENTEPKDPPAPTSYGGPGMIAMMNGSVWFDNGSQLYVGEEASGVSVVSISSPWDARLRWRGVEFTVPLFEKDKVVAPKSRSDAENKLGGMAPTPVAKPADASKPADEKPEDAKPPAPTTDPSKPAADAPKPEPAKPDAPTPEQSKPEPPKPELPKPDPAKPDSAPQPPPSGPPKPTPGQP